MTGVCFFFENEDIDVWSGKNLDAWHYAIYAAKDINEILVINRTEQILQNPNQDKYIFNTTKEIPELNGNIVGITVPWRQEILNSFSLWNFNHQNIDWYCFGSAAGELPKYNIEVFIPQNGKGALHSVHIASAVMLHRYGVLNWQSL